MDCEHPAHTEEIKAKTVLPTSAKEVQSIITWYGNCTACDSSTTSSLWHGGSVACTAASQQEGHGFDSRMGCCWLWGAGPPQSAQCSGGLSPGPFCVEFACSPCVHK